MLQILLYPSCPSVDNVDLSLQTDRGHSNEKWRVCWACTALPLGFLCRLHTKMSYQNPTEAVGGWASKWERQAIRSGLRSLSVRLNHCKSFWREERLLFIQKKELVKCSGNLQQVYVATVCLIPTIWLISSFVPWCCLVVEPATGCTSLLHC